jgi:hypothetical protein
MVLIRASRLHDVCPNSEGGDTMRPHWNWTLESYAYHFSLGRSYKLRTLSQRVVNSNRNISANRFYHHFLCKKLNRRKKAAVILWSTWITRSLIMLVRFVWNWNIPGLNKPRTPLLLQTLTRVTFGHFVCETKN